MHFMYKAYMVYLQTHLLHQIYAYIRVQRICIEKKPTKLSGTIYTRYGIHGGSL